MRVLVRLQDSNDAGKWVSARLLRLRQPKKEAMPTPVGILESKPFGTRYQSWLGREPSLRSTTKMRFKFTDPENAWLWVFAVAGLAFVIALALLRSALKDVTP